MEDQPVTLRLRLSHLSDEELEVLAQQAQSVGMHRLPDRQGVAEVFLLVYGTALAEQRNRNIGHDVSYVAHARPDETAPLSHQATDLGYAMAITMPLIDDAETPPAVRTIWSVVLGALGAELRRRGPPA